MELRQRFFLASISGQTLQLSPDTTGTCTRDTAFPPHLANRQVVITTTHETPDGEMWPATTGCTQYEVIIRRRT